MHRLRRGGRPALATLIEAYNESTVEGLMCRHQINVDPQGRLFDCDFNQALELPTPGRELPRERPIIVGFGPAGMFAALRFVQPDTLAATIADQVPNAGE